jgi:hypothetical protein
MKLNLVNKKILITSLSSFPQFKRMDEWGFEDFSDYEEKEFVLNMILSQ